MKMNNYNYENMSQDMVQCIIHDQQKNKGKNKRDRMMKDKQKRLTKKNKRY